ncbi:ATP-binding cassette domain-containing protein [Iocasia frigidifontis]|uniref:ATP-binding cassette domain-containing protein n=1 Tax=Iocasia fonsfrigidae TaxID=2682810 RepID=A0A8A7KDK0_9FIRM|nr:ATP-binding cassette domain-containing protein [Iocasia fonsfrigidae]
MLIDGNAVEIKNLVKKYPGVEALQGVDINFPAGRITGLIGPNGSGKSTILKSIVGLVKPSRGELLVFGQKLDRRLKEKVAFLPEINHLYKNMKIVQIIDFFQSQFSTFERKRALEILDFMNLKPEMRIKSLSKGMAGRVKLVLTMARNVPLIVMDEPLAGIDPQSRARILEGLINEYDAEKQTIILSTHEVLEAERFFDYVVFLEYGTVKLQGNADDLRSEHGMSIQDLVKEVFI